MVSLRLKSIYKSFGEVTVLKNITMSVDEGSLAVILGPSGCGKTTTLKIIAGLLRPDRGKVFFDSVDVTNIPPRLRDVGMVFQNLALFPHMTVEENIAYGLKARRWDDERIKRRVKELIELLHLEGLERRLPRQLSGGQQQRVALARALAPNPRLLLLDEPLRNLDANLRDELLWEIKRLQEELGTTTIYVTHDQSEAFQLADKVFIMKNGTIVQQGSPEEVYRKPVDSFVARFLGYNVLNIPYEIKESTFLYRLSEDGRNFIELKDKGLLAIRPEDLRLGSDSPPYLEGRVVGVRYSKIFYRIKVLTKHGEVEVLSREPVKVGNVVKVRVEKDRVLVLNSELSEH